MPSYQQFKLPDVGEGLTEAEIAEWRVSAGDTVTVNQVLLEIETAKSLVELPAPWAGVVTELLVQEGQTVAVGSPIVVIDTDPGGAPSDDGGTSAGTLPSEDQDHDDDGASAAGGSGSVLVGYGTKEAAPARRRRRSPAPSATEGVTAAEAGPATGGAEPNTVPATRTAAHTTAPPAMTGPLAPPSSSASAASAPSAPNRAAAHVLAKPPVRKFAKDLGVDLSAVAATGPGGIITRDDVQAYATRSEAQTLATYPGDDKPWLTDGVVAEDGRRTHVPVRSVRRRTAEAMVDSAFTAPHVTVFHTVDVTRSMRLVARLKEDRAFADVRVTPLLLAAKAFILAVRRHPQINAAWDAAAEEIIYKHYINLGIAAATPRGLVVPNIKDAHRLNLHELATEIAGLTATARAGRTTPQAMSDGTVTLTNVGVFGIDTGTPILNPGESAILALGAIRKQPWVHKNKVKPRWVTQLALSFDHRLVDGELGSRVLADVAAVLENPGMGLVWG